MDKENFTHPEIARLNIEWGIYNEKRAMDIRFRFINREELSRADIEWAIHSAADGWGAYIDKLVKGYLVDGRE